MWPKQSQMHCARRNKLFQLSRIFLGKYSLSPDYFFVAAAFLGVGRVFVRVDAVSEFVQALYHAAVDGQVERRQDDAHLGVLARTCYHAFRLSRMVRQVV